MKKWMLIFHILIIVIASSAETIEKTFSFHTYDFHEKEGFKILQMQGTRLMGKTGNPLLPCFSAVIILPPGEAVDAVRVITKNEVPLQVMKRIIPKQPARPLSDTIPIVFQMNKKVYEENAFYPQSQLLSTRTAFLNGYSVATILFTPVQYNPVSSQLVIHRDITLKIETVIDQKAMDALKFLRGSIADQDRLDQLCHDTHLLPRYVLNSVSESFNILVIVPAEFKSDFTEYKNFYLRKGLKTHILTVEEIQASYPGQDLQEIIRNAIIDAYQKGIEHVVLAGDAEHIPYRGFYCEVQSGDDLYKSTNIPSDLYYSALDGTWDDDGDHVWGEIGEEDLLPEVSIGRIPFSTKEDLDNQLHKIFTYQLKPVLGELRQPLLAAEKFWENPLSWGADYFDLLIGHHSDNGYTTQGIPENYNYVTLTDRDDGRWTSQDLLEKIEEGPSFIHHSGHSNTSYNLRMTSSEITDETFSAINGNDHNYPIIISHGCNSGSFDSDDCIGEIMVNIQNFALAYVGNSRYGWDNEGQTEGPSTHLHRELMDAFYGQKIETLGQAHRWSKINTAPWVNQPNEWEEGAQRWTFYGNNILGDPALAVWSDEPMVPSMTYERITLGYDEYLYVQVQIDQGTAEDFRCALMSQDSLIGVVTFDENGIAQLPFDSSEVASNRVELIVSGCNCLITSFPVDGLTNEEVPEKGILVFQNYPNPFNESTTFKYSLAEESEVKLRIFNIKGQLVKTLVQKEQTRGPHFESWDGTDELGHKVSSGVYLYHVQSGNREKIFKMTLLR